ncbi:MAG: Ig domain-containing protein [Spirochaetales bacterium]|nr:Ig domain-containing protein [Spirochaetales bacterium]
MKTKILFKFFMTAVVLSILLSGCNLFNPGNNEQESTVIQDNAPVSRSFDYPEGKKYLGDGYNLLNGELKRSCVTVDEARKTYGSRYYADTYTFVSNDFELKMAMNYNMNVGAGATLFENLTGSTSLYTQVAAGTQISTETITIIGRVEYEEGTVFINKESMNDTTAQTYFVSSPNTFRNLYGDGYVNKAKIGEQLFLVFQAIILESNTYLKSEIKTAAEMKFLEIFNSSSNSQLTTEMEAKLKSCLIVGKCYATGGFTPGQPVQDKESFLAIYKKFQSFVDSKIYGSSSLEFNVLSQAYGSYSDLFNRTALEIDSFHRKSLEWLKEKARINLIKNMNYSSYINSLCNQALDKIDAELVKCVNRSSSARYPSSNEFPTLNNAVFAYHKKIQYRSHVKGKGWLGWVDDGSTSGTTGESRRMEALQVRFPHGSLDTWHVNYQAHVQGIGWMSWVKDGQTAGTTGEGRRMEAVKIKIQGLPWGYAVRYRAYVEKNGWLGWVQNGAVGGTTGEGKRMEAIQIKIQKANCLLGSYDGAHCYVGKAPTGTKPFIYSNNFYYTSLNGTCPLAGSWYDGANCYVARIPSGTTGFIYNNGWYVNPLWE